MQFSKIEVFYRETRKVRIEESVESLRKFIEESLPPGSSSNRVEIAQAGAGVLKVSCSYNSKDVESLSYALEIRDLIESRGRNDNARHNESIQGGTYGSSP